MKEKIGGLRELALFAGGGGGILGGRLLGWRTVCAVEFAPYARSVLLARQRDGHLERFPIWDDVRTFDGRPWSGSVDVVSGGFPCQDISAAGKGAGIEGARSGLWGEMARIIGEVRPSFALVENSPMLTSRGLGVVLGDLAAMGYDARWGVLGARHVGAPHKRDRIWIVATDANSKRRRAQQVTRTKREDQTEPGDDGATEVVADAGSRWAAGREPNTQDVSKARRFRKDYRGRSLHNEPSEAQESSRNSRAASDVAAASQERLGDSAEERTMGGEGSGVPGDGTRGEQRQRTTPQWWQTEPELGRVADGVADRVDRLKALGNGQVSAVVALAWDTLGGER